MAQSFELFMLLEGMPKEARINLEHLGKLIIEKTGTIYSPRYLMERFSIDQKLLDDVVQAWCKAGFISIRKNHLVAVIRKLSRSEREVLQLMD